MGKNTKRKKSFYLAPSKRQRLDTIIGTVGFLGTCNTHEDVCVKEAYNLLNIYAEKLYGPEKNGGITTGSEAVADAAPTTALSEAASTEAESSNALTDTAIVPQVVVDSSDEDEDIETALKKEVASLQASTATKDGKGARPVRRFQAIRCGAANNVFFRTTLPDPLPTLRAAMDDILSCGEQQTKYLIRLLPVHMVCKAYLDKIEKTLTAFCMDRFMGQTKSYYAVIKVMSNTTVKKEEILSVVLKVMEEVAPECKPVLTKDADVAVVVSVLVTNCYIGEAPLYLDKYKKYNLIELASPSVAAAVKAPAVSPCSESKPIEDGSTKTASVGGDPTPSLPHEMQDHPDAPAAEAGTAGGEARP